MSTSAQNHRDDFVDAIIARAGRSGGAVAIRTSFLQSGPQRAPIPGPLSKFIRGGDERGLDLYLMLRALISSDKQTGEWDTVLTAEWWAVGLNLTTPNNDGAQAISKVWRRLSERGLVDRSRKGNYARITLLNEDGSGAPYSYPTGKGPGRYFKLSEAYWTDDERWYRELSLAAKTMLLIASSLKPGFALPQEQAKPWYGISPETAGNGLRELSDTGLLKITKQRRNEPLAPKGYVIEHRYKLQAPFEQNWQNNVLAPVITLPGTGTA